MSNEWKPIDSMAWLEAELEDTLDEDFELELSEPALTEELRKIQNKRRPESIGRCGKVAGFGDINQKRPMFLGHFRRDQSEKTGQAILIEVIV